MTHPPTRPPLIIHNAGAWPFGRLRTRWVGSTHRLPESLVGLIDASWNDAKSRLGEKLFDGPMCRMERWGVDESDVLEIELSATSYRMFLGTNLERPQIADTFGRAVLANPVGVSPALVSVDGFVLLGRRNGSVAYYPHRIHPFAGALEPTPVVCCFQQVRRELREELELDDAELSRVVCTGVAEDVSIRQPELIFAAWSTLDRQTILARMLDEEHCGHFSVPLQPQSLARVLREEMALTPVASAAVLLLGRLVFGDEWFCRNAVGLAELPTIAAS